MNKYLTILFFIINLIFITSCAKPKVVNTILPGDEKLNCKQLQNAIIETKKIKRDAEYAKKGTGGNLARMILFWPAWAKTLHNADVAILAANDRNFHLTKLMRKKNCERANNTKTFNENIFQQLKNLNEMYKSGILTKEEFEKAKKKTLDN